MLRTSIAVMLLGFVLFSTVSGAVIIRSDWINLDESRESQGDLYLFGRQIDFYGDSKGDMVAMGQHINIAGQVRQNLYTVAQTIKVAGEIDHDFWGFAQTIELDGKILGGFRGACAELMVNCEVTGDIIVGAGQVNIGPNAVVDGNLYVGCGRLYIAGEITGEVIGGVEELVVSGTIHKNVKLEVGEVIFEPEARLEGDFTYTRSAPLDIDFKKFVAGEVKFKQCEPVDIECPLARWWNIWFFFSALVTALIIVAFFSGRLKENFELFSEQPWRTLLYGFLGFIVMPAVIAIACVTLIGIPIGLILAVFYGVFLYTGYLVGGILLGRLIFQLFKAAEPSLVLSALVGIVLLFLLGMIPFFGGLVCFAALLFGLGIILVALYNLFWGQI